MSDLEDRERRRLHHDRAGWRRWGPFLPYRQWGTLREARGETSDPWRGFPRDEAPHRAYRWGEDGIFGWCDERCRMILAPALWNGVDPVLKERFFGLDHHEGVQGEDVKECYEHLDATPSASYCAARYRYPRRAFPYRELIAAPGPIDLAATGALDDGWFDLSVTYAKPVPDQVVQRLSVTNRGPEPATVHLLAQLWLRNTWAWDDAPPAGAITPTTDGLHCTHDALGEWALSCLDHSPDRVLVAANETNHHRFGERGADDRGTRDGIQRAVVAGDMGGLAPGRSGTKAAAWFRWHLAPGEERSVHLHLRPGATPAIDTADATELLRRRRDECRAFYRSLSDDGDDGLDLIARRAWSGLCWNRQYYGWDVARWVDGDPSLPSPPARRQHPSASWRHLRNHDVLIVPDKWEFPWYAAWDHACHTVAYAAIDAVDAARMLELLFEPRYQHPAGGLPAFEMDLAAANPPLHAWAVRKVAAALGAQRGSATGRAFLTRCWGDLLQQAGWWLNRRDPQHDDIFGGGFMGLDNIGPLGRPRTLDDGRRLEQADSSAWVASMLGHLLAIGLDRQPADGTDDRVLASLVQQFLLVAESVNRSVDAGGLWHEGDGCYYDRLHDPEGSSDQCLRLRSLVGLLPLLAVVALDPDRVTPGLQDRVTELVAARPGLGTAVVWDREGRLRGLRLVPPQRVRRLLELMLDPAEFLSDFGIRSLSAWHRDHPVTLRSGGEEDRVRYQPGALAGTNSNWRGPIWIHVNYLLIEALRLHGELLEPGYHVPVPGVAPEGWPLATIADHLGQRLLDLFTRPREDHHPADRDLVLFHEFYHAETGTGCGASHLTGWTALVAELIARQRAVRT